MCGYGAPGKGNTLLNYCGIGTDFLDFTVDRNPYKHGRFTPGMHIPILPVDALDAAQAGLHPHPAVEPEGRDRPPDALRHGLGREVRRPDSRRHDHRSTGVRGMKVVLFCGGLGTRIREYSENVPKPMIPLGHQPIMQHVMQYYSDYGHNDFVLCLGYKANVIKDFFLDFRPQTFGDCVVSDGGRDVQLLGEIEPGLARHA